MPIMQYFEAIAWRTAQAVCPWSDCGINKKEASRLGSRAYYMPNLP